LRVRHFAGLDDSERERLFLHPPEAFDARADSAFLATALGASLYCPASRPQLAEDVRRRCAAGAVSMILCLEDAVADDHLTAAESNVVAAVRDLAEDRNAAPLLFIRVRAADQIGMLAERLGPAAGVLTGVVLPKFDSKDGEVALDALVAANGATGARWYAMPVIETQAVARLETRVDALAAIRQLLDRFADDILAVRIGATDLGSHYGLRRGREHTVYDVGVLAAVIADVVNVLGRAVGGFPVTGPVWEHFPASERVFKPLLRETPFAEHRERRLRAELLARDLDGLIREVILDRANGLTGKSVIHPTHVAPVHALSVVSHEEYRDAQDILDTRSGGGVAASSYRNKMNESKPHAAWARRTLLRSRVFGVARPEVSFVDLLAASMHA
jgi:citrate lyase beta subunit